ncbi:hypothetical protein Tco_1225774 [Tanacetum coccineum]
MCSGEAMLMKDECFDPGRGRVMLKLTIPSHMSLRIYLLISPYPLRFLPYCFSTENKTPFLSPQSTLNHGISSGWNFHVLKCLSNINEALIEIFSSTRSPGQMNSGSKSSYVTRYQKQSASGGTSMLRPSIFFIYTIGSEEACTFPILVVVCTCDCLQD